DNAEVRLSIDTSMSGGSALTCVAERPRNPAGPSAEHAVTIVLPTARWPMARQNVLASIIFRAGSAVAALIRSTSEGGAERRFNNRNYAACPGPIQAAPVANSSPASRVYGAPDHGKCRRMAAIPPSRF